MTIDPHQTARDINRTLLARLASLGAYLAECEREEIEQEAMCRVLSALDHGDYEGHIGSLIWLCVRSAYADSMQYRCRNRQQHVFHYDEDRYRQKTDNDEAGLIQLLARVDDKRLRQVGRELGRGRSMTDTASSLGISRRELFRCRQELADQLAPVCPSPR